MGFCPDLETARPLCAQKKTDSYHPIKHRTDSSTSRRGDNDTWVAFRATSTRSATRISPRTTGKIPHSKLDSSKVGHRILRAQRTGGTTGCKKTSRAQRGAQARKPSKRQLQETAETLNDKRIAGAALTIERPADTWPPYFAILYSGDGGWADIDRESRRTSTRRHSRRRDGLAQYLWSGKTQEKSRKTSASSSKLLRDLRRELGGARGLFPRRDMIPPCFSRLETRKRFRKYANPSSSPRDDIQAGIFTCSTG